MSSGSWPPIMAGRVAASRRFVQQRPGRDGDRGQERLVDDQVLRLAVQVRRIMMAVPARAERWSWTVLALPLAACLARSSRADTALGAYAVFLSFLPGRDVQPTQTLISA
jgi:hypothetical protein